jgi:adenylate cyclase
MSHADQATIEIERKFILSEAPPAERLGPGVQIRLGYLAVEDTVEVRIRITPSNAALTVKAGPGLSRTEVDVAISVEQADALWLHTAQRRIDKTRHRMLLDDPAGDVAEVDVYAGALPGLCVAEVGFSSETAATFTEPDWFGRELTGEAAWSNAALARRGRPD